MKAQRILLAVPLLGVLLVGGCSQQTGDGGEGGGLFSRIKPAPPIVLPVGTQLAVRLTTGVDSKNNKAGDTFMGTLEHPVVAGEKVALPKGAEVKGRVTQAVPSGRLKQRAELWVTLTEVSLKGKTYPLASTTAGHKEGSKTTRDIVFIGGGAGAGAAIGGLAGGGKGAAIGTAVGAGGGTAGAMLTGQRDIKFPPETLLNFRLEQELKL